MGTQDRSTGPRPPREGSPPSVVPARDGRWGPGRPASRSVAGAGSPDPAETRTRGGVATGARPSPVGGARVLGCPLLLRVRVYPVHRPAAVRGAEWRARSGASATMERSFGTVVATAPRFGVRRLDAHRARVAATLRPRDTTGPVRPVLLGFTEPRTVLLVPVAARAGIADPGSAGSCNGEITPTAVGKFVPTRDGFRRQYHTQSPHGISPAVHPSRIGFFRDFRLIRTIHPVEASVLSVLRLSIVDSARRLAGPARGGTQAAGTPPFLNHPV